MPWLKSGKKRILIVDDEPVVGEITSKFLQDAGFKAAYVTTADAALHRMEADSVDVVILDIFLETDSGIGLLGKLKSLYPKVPVIMLTGAGYDDDMMKTALEEGAAGYVSKDIDLEDIVVAVRRVLS